MTLDQLRIFAAVASVEHITRGAEKLNLSQSAVSAAIKALETRYDIELFDRVGRSIVLNPAGRNFLPEALKVLASAAAAEAALIDLGNLQVGDLSIMASNTIVSHWLPKRLAAFRRQYPGIKLRTSMGNTSEVTAAVKAGVAEIGLIEWPTDDPDVAAMQLDEDEMVVIVSPDHPWASRTRPIDNLSETSWVLRELGSGTRFAFKSLLELHAIPAASIDVVMELPDNSAVVGAVEQGLGATLISKSAAETSILSGRAVQTTIAPLPRPYFLIRNPDRYNSNAAKAFEKIALDRAKTPSTR